MNKSCDNCEYKDCCNGMSKVLGVPWDTSKDYCSKFEKKENKIDDILFNILVPGNTSCGYKKEMIMSLFKQRIEESLKEAEKKVLDFSYKAQVRPQTSEIVYKQAFDWILKC